MTLGAHEKFLGPDYSWQEAESTRWQESILNDKWAYKTVKMWKLQHFHITSIKHESNWTSIEVSKF